jgi:hypothetical protein
MRTCGCRKLAPPGRCLRDAVGSVTRRGAWRAGWSDQHIAGSPAGDRLRPVGIRDVQKLDTGPHVGTHALSQVYETPSSSGEMAPQHCPRILQMIAANAFPLAEHRHREYVQGARGREVSSTDRSRCGCPCLEHGGSSGYAHDHGGTHDRPNSIQEGTGPADADRRRTNRKSTCQRDLDRRCMRWPLRRRGGVGRSPGPPAR